MGMAVRIACLMMQRNEGLLLETWVKYHGEMFGYENLYIYDNGSTEESTVRAISDLSLRFPVNLDTTFVGKRQFERKGELFVEKIRILEGTNEFDFFIPLDCDEFVTVSTNSGIVSFDKERIFLELEQHLDARSALVIPGCYYNVPNLSNYYYYLNTEKTFFANGAAGFLDVGFHHGKSRYNDTRATTQIQLMHFHNKPFEILKQHAFQKLEGRVKDFSGETLNNYIGPGAHLLKYFRMSETDYLYSFPSDPADRALIYIPGFLEKIREIGAEIPY